MEGEQQRMKKGYQEKRGRKGALLNRGESTNLGGVLERGLKRRPGYNGSAIEPQNKPYGSM